MSIRRVLLLPGEGSRFELRVEDAEQRVMSSSLHDIGDLSDPAVMKMLGPDAPYEVTIDPVILGRMHLRFDEVRHSDKSFALAFERLIEASTSVMKGSGIKPGRPPIMRGASKNGLSDGSDFPAAEEGGSDER